MSLHNSIAVNWIPMGFMRFIQTHQLSQSVHPFLHNLFLELVNQRSTSEDVVTFSDLRRSFSPDDDLAIVHLDLPAFHPEYGQGSSQRIVSRWITVVFGSGIFTKPLKKSLHRRRYLETLGGLETMLCEVEVHEAFINKNDVRCLKLH